MALLAGRYELGSILGRGGMAEVRAGRDTRLDRPVAIKMLLPGRATDPDCRRRFRTEAAVGAGLSHPNIVAVLDAGEDDGVAFIVMERVAGMTLQDVMAQGTLHPERVRQLAGDVLAGLTAAHQAGVIHRDLKPSNILARGDGHWKVADFGTVRQTTPDEADATVTGIVVGTPAYIAPERLFGQPATPSSDLYSLGVVLYEALVGQRPFETWDSYPWSGAVAGYSAPPIRSLQPDVPEALAATVERALSLDPARRFGSAREMAKALAEGGRSETTRTMLIPPIGRDRSRRRPIAVAAGTAALALGLGLAVVLLGHHGSAPVSGVPPTHRTVPPTTFAPSTYAPSTAAPPLPSTDIPTTLALTGRGAPHASSARPPRGKHPGPEKPHGKGG